MAAAAARLRGRTARPSRPGSPPPARGGCRPVRVLGTALAVRGAAQALRLQLHRAPRGEAGHPAQDEGVRTLLRQPAEGDPVVGHRGRPEARFVGLDIRVPPSATAVAAATPGASPCTADRDTAARGRSIQSPVRGARLRVRPSIAIRREDDIPRHPGPHRDSQRPAPGGWAFGERRLLPRGKEEGLNSQRKDFIMSERTLFSANTLAGGARSAIPPSRSSPGCAAGPRPCPSAPPRGRPGAARGWRGGSARRRNRRAAFRWRARRSGAAPARPRRP